MTTTYTMIHFESSQFEAREIWETPYGEVAVGSITGMNLDSIPAEHHEEVQLAIMRSEEGHI